MQSEMSMNSIHPYVIHCSHLNKHNCPPRGVSFNPRRTRWCELEFIVWGEGVILTEGKTLDAVKGRLFFRQPGMNVEGIAPYYSYVVLFDSIYDARKETQYRASAIEQFHNPENQTQPELTPGFNPDSSPIPNPDFPLRFPAVISLESADFLLLQRIFQEINLEFIHNGQRNQFTLKTLILQLLLYLYKHSSREMSAPLASRAVNRHYNEIIAIKTYIDQHVSSRFELSQLAELAGLSRNFFITLFKQTIGDTPVRYINKQKINLAKQLLLQTNLNVKEIGYRCGFETLTYFYRVFKEYERLTPLQYKEHFGLTIEIANTNR